MAYPLAGLLIGALLGGFRAKSKGGAAADIAQWAIVFALILGVLGMFAAIIHTRMIT